MRHWIAAATVAALTAGTGSAQLGTSPGAFAERWGTPIDRRQLDEGMEQVVFRSPQGTIEAGFVAEKAQQVVYGPGVVARVGVSALLALNDEGREWLPGAVPGRRNGEGPRKEWVRSDEIAMARLESEALTVTRGPWNRRMRTALSRMPDRTVAADGASAPAVGTPAGAAPGVVGIWRHERMGAPVIVLRVLPEGTARWVVYQNTRKRIFEAAWTSAPEPDEAGWTLRTAPGPEDAADAVALLRRVEADRLILSLDSVRPKDTSMVHRWYLAPRMAFERIAAMPLWKPAAPARLPERGELRADAVRLLGEPDGRMVVGEREVLVYPWGNVWIVEGRVAGID